MFRSDISSPYLKPNRLADVLAALQVMAVSEFYRRSVEDWVYYLSGLERDASDQQKLDLAITRWRTVFEDHPEFFRPSTASPGNYALVLRRGLSKRYDLQQLKVLNDKEIDSLPEDAGPIVRAPLAHAEIKALLDIALSLHKEAAEREAAKRWHWQLWVPVTGSLIGGFLALAGGLLVKLTSH